MTADANGAVSHEGNVSHAELVRRAGAWLASTRRCSFVLCEPVAFKCSEIPDAIGWLPDGESIVVECKVSMSDLRANRRKRPRSLPRFRGKQYKPGRMGHRRFFLVPNSLVVDPASIEEGWGLLELRGKRVFIIKEAALLRWNGATAREELRLLIARSAHHSDKDWQRFCEMEAEGEDG